MDFFQTWFISLKEHGGMVIIMIRKIADRVVNGNDTNWAMNINSFDWVPGVGLYGIFGAYKKTGDKKYFDFLIDWAEKHLDEAYKKQTINSVAPMLTIAELYNITKNEKYYKVCTDLAEYVTKTAPVTSEGGLEHTVTEPGAGFAEQMWADTLFMACLFLAKFGKHAEKEEYVKFAQNQLLIHLKALRDEKTGLFYHGYSCIYKNHLSGIKWGRANAWIIFSATEILKTAPDFDGADFVKEAIGAQIKALKPLQRKSGGFGTILDDSDSYDEISATAGIAAGIRAAAELGIADEPQMYENAVNAVKSAVDKTGTVTGVSSGTPIMKDAQAYKNIICEPTLYGQALAILAM